MQSRRHHQNDETQLRSISIEIARASSRDQDHEIELARSETRDRVREIFRREEPGGAGATSPGLYLLRRFSKPPTHISWRARGAPRDATRGGPGGGALPRRGHKT